jgi:hypothetical protein
MQDKTKDPHQPRLGLRLRLLSLVLSGALFVCACLLLTTTQPRAAEVVLRKQRHLGTAVLAGSIATHRSVADRREVATLEHPRRIPSVDLPAAGFPVLLFCNNRADLLNRTLASLLAIRGVSRDRVIASQDGSDPRNTDVLERWAVAYWVHPKAPLDARRRRKAGAALIAEHYKWAIERAFATFARASALVIAEDDMDFAPDFMDWFTTLSPLLERDPTLWTISAFNDNGFAERVLDDERVLRTDWTIGFGWLLTRRLWEAELRDQWPATHWDHWMRSDQRRKGRETLFPEVSRNFHTGARGTHSEPGLYARYFARIRLSSAQAPVLARGDLGGLTAARYDDALVELLAHARVVRSLAELEAPTNATAVESADALVLVYAARDGGDKVWQAVATYFGFWHTLPVRGAHRGLLCTRHHGRRLLLVPSWSPFAARLPAGTPQLDASEFARHGALTRLSRGWMAAAALKS